MMTGWTFVIIASIAISTITVFVWYRFLKPKERALLVSVLTVFIVAPLIVFVSLEYRLDFDWSALGDSPADGLLLVIGAIETFGIWVGSIIIVVFAHFIAMDRYSRQFRSEDDHADAFE